MSRHIHLQRRTAAILFVGLSVILLLGWGCSSKERAEAGAEVSGYWEASFPDEKTPSPDRFVFEFSGDEPGAAAASVHVFHNGTKREELPLQEMSVRGGRIRFELRSTGVAFEGDLEKGGTSISGKLLYAGGGSQATRLTRLDPSAVRGVRSRPEGAGAYRCAAPVETEDGWETASLTEAGLDDSLIREGVVRVIAGEYGEIHSLLLVKGGKLALEEYFYDFDRETPHPVQSCTKSVVSLLVGIAIDQGSLGGVEEGVLSFFPEYDSLRTPGWEKVTLQHLLTMTAGLAWDPEARMEYEGAADPLLPVLSRPVRHEPGTQFEYESPNVNLLAGVLRRATGMHADRFARRFLFEPMGFGEVRWEEGNRNGMPRCDGTLTLRPRDMAKIGSLLLTGGTWKGAAIVSEGWIRESTATQTAEPGGEEYGYLWWKATRPYAGGEVRSVFANGMGSQFIFALPDLDMVVVTTGGNHGNGLHFAPVRLIQEYVLPAIS